MKSKNEDKDWVRGWNHAVSCCLDWISARSFEYEEAIEFWARKGYRDMLDKHTHSHLEELAERLDITWRRETAEMFGPFLHDLRRVMFESWGRGEGSTLDFDEGWNVSSTLLNVLIDIHLFQIAAIPLGFDEEGVERPSLCALVQVVPLISLKEYLNDNLKPDRRGVLAMLNPLINSEGLSERIREGIDSLESLYRRAGEDHETREAEAY